jgi:hypothetical protein
MRSAKRRKRIRRKVLLVSLSFPLPLIRALCSLLSSPWSPYILLAAYPVPLSKSQASVLPPFKYTILPRTSPVVFNLRDSHWMRLGPTFFILETFGGHTPFLPFVPENWLCHSIFDSELTRMEGDALSCLDPIRLLRSRIGAIS